eukprot:368058-Amphidinium_carterae.1
MSTALCSTQTLSGFRKARQLELDWIKSREVYERVPLNQCLERTGKKPLSMKWVPRGKEG